MDEQVDKIQHERAMILSSDGKGIADGAELAIRGQSALEEDIIERPRCHSPRPRRITCRGHEESEHQEARKGMLGRTDCRAEWRRFVPVHVTSSEKYALSSSRLALRQNNHQDTQHHPLHSCSWSNTQTCGFCHGWKQAVCPQHPQTNLPGPCSGLRCAQEGRSFTWHPDRFVPTR